MAAKEILVDHSELQDPQTITARNERMFKEHGMDIHQNDVLDITDDHKKKVRRYKISHVKYFDMGRSKH